MPSAAARGIGPLVEVPHPVGSRKLPRRRSVAFGDRPGSDRPRGRQGGDQVKRPSGNVVEFLGEAPGKLDSSSSLAGQESNGLLIG